MKKLQFFDLPKVLDGVRKDIERHPQYSPANHVVMGLLYAERRNLIEVLREVEPKYTRAEEGKSISRKHYALICEEDWVDELQAQVEALVNEHRHEKAKIL